MAVIIRHDYHQGKFENKAQILGMKLAGATAVLTVAMVILDFIMRKKRADIVYSSN